MGDQFGQAKIRELSESRAETVAWRDVETAVRVGHNKGKIGSHLSDDLDVLHAAGEESQRVFDNGIEVGRCLFAAKCAVQVGTDSGVASVAGDFTDVVDVINDPVQF